MAYDEELAGRVRAVLSAREGISERRMFGGLSFLRDGNLVCGVMGEALLVRLGEEQARAALVDPHVRLMDLQRRPARGIVYVDPETCAGDEALRGWVDRALAFVATLPAKPAGRAARGR
ncbi:TfoX/Sxy family protein [Conexibacter arvalis]|uniref:TfoX/Sxy family transcriptional regulator of competence genes n=1 Tax=Conexibacter arvalis TaxID=912552 RepID=A0A840IBX2_9ACTN|nr:TfoX/Sxy family protein [Conexibacter arvalis]MBB4662427.1 TfoX/Sxy family transcriptional regulator of competence genes [Conexibacter arvalis]